MVCGGGGGEKKNDSNICHRDVYVVMVCAHYVYKQGPFRISCGEHFIKTSQRRLMKGKNNRLVSLNLEPEESLCVCGSSASCSSEGGDLGAASILCVTHICVCPRGSSSKEPGLKRQAGQAQYGGVSPALEKSSTRPHFFFFHFLSIFPRSSAHIHLILLIRQSHFVEGKKKKKRMKVEQDS